MYIYDPRKLSLQYSYKLNVKITYLRFCIFLFSHGGDNLVLLSGVPVVKHSEQILPGSIDRLSQQEVGEEKLVALVVKLVVSILNC